MRFKFDENLPVQAAALFREAGHDAATVLEQAMKGDPDEVVAQVCSDENRIIVTLDVDFADITAIRQAPIQGSLCFVCSVRMLSTFSMFWLNYSLCWIWSRSIRNSGLSTKKESEFGDSRRQQEA